MSRSITMFQSPFAPQAAFDSFAQYMTSEGFALNEKNGEQFWTKGSGFFTAPQFLKLTLNNDGTFVLEAWIKLPLLPGVFVGEMGTKGFIGCVPKQFLQSRVDTTLRAMQARVTQRIN